MEEKRIRQKLASLENTIEVLIKVVLTRSGKEVAMLEDIAAKVTKLEEVVPSVKALLAELKAKLDEIASNPSVDAEQLKKEIADLSDRIGKEDQELADAVAANTPVGEDEVAPAPAPSENS